MNKAQLELLHQKAKENPAVERMLNRLGPESTIKVLKVVRNLRRAASKPQTST